MREQKLDKELAEIAQTFALRAVKELHSIVRLNADWDCPSGQKLRRGIGLAIGSIEVDILGLIYSEFPELDDLKT
jgi:hypothetical protein